MRTRKEFEESSRINRFIGADDRIRNDCTLALEKCSFSIGSIATAFGTTEDVIHARIKACREDKTVDPALSPRVRKLLIGANINTYDPKFLRDCSRKDLLKIHGIGAGAIAEIEEWLLYTYGRKLAPDHEPEPVNTEDLELPRRTLNTLARYNLTQNDAREIAAIGWAWITSNMGISAPARRELKAWVESKGYEMAP